MSSVFCGSNKWQNLLTLEIPVEDSDKLWMELIRKQCRRFLWARNLLAKAPCWYFPKRGEDEASQRERGGGGEREEKMPAQKHCENEKHPLIRRVWPLFWKLVADNNKTTKQSLQSRIVLRKTSWSLSLFLSWPSHNAILHSWWSFSLSCNSFF